MVAGQGVEAALDIVEVALEQRRNIGEDALEARSRRPRLEAPDIAVRLGAAEPGGGEIMAHEPRDAARLPRRIGCTFERTEHGFEVIERMQGGKGQ